MLTSVGSNAIQLSVGKGKKEKNQTYLFLHPCATIFSSKLGEGMKSRRPEICTLSSHFWSLCAVDLKEITIHYCLWAQLTILMASVFALTCKGDMLTQRYQQFVPLLECQAVVGQHRIRCMWGRFSSLWNSLIDIWITHSQSAKETAVAASLYNTFAGCTAK